MSSARFPEDDVGGRRRGAGIQTDLRFISSPASRSQREALPRPDTHKERITRKIGRLFGDEL